MKILAEYNSSGGSFHRVWLPLAHNKEHKTRLTEELTEDIINEFKPDIVYIHWQSMVSIPILSMWKSKYKFKVVADIDDSWKGLPNSFKRTIFQSQNLCIFADAVICTNDFLKKQIVEFNENCTIIPNYLPPNYSGDFVRTYGEKLKIGIYGSIKGHYKNWLSLKYIIRRLKKDKELKGKIEFIICGVDKTKEWEEIIKFFPKNNTKIFENVAPEESIELMKNIDILLCPLNNSDLSRGRSNLKIEEAVSCFSIPVISENYIEKSLFNKSFPILNFQNIKEIVLNKEKRDSILKNIMIIKSLRKDDYEKYCIFSRYNVFEKVLNKKETKKRPEPEIYSIKYLPEQIGEYKEFFNGVKTIKEKSYLFEYNPMILLSSLSETKGYFGVFSYKFPLKTGFYKKLILDILDNEKSDVVIFCKPITNYLNWSEKQHPGLLKILDILCKKLNLELREPTYTIYSNFFVAKGDIYKEYVSLIKKAIEYLESDKDLNELVWKDSNYMSGLNLKELEENTELKYYTYHTFVLERLASIWFENNQGISKSVYF